MKLRVFLALLGLLFSVRQAPALTADEKQCLKADKTVITVCTRLINRTSSRTSKAMYLNNRAYAWEDEGNCEFAISDFGEAIELWPTKDFGDLMYRDLHIRLAAAWGEDCKGDQAKAISILDNVIRNFPQSVAAYFNRGNAEAELRNFDKAIADYNSALRNAESTEQKAKILNSRAIAWRDSGELDRAYADSSEATRLDRTEAQYLFNFGDISRLKGDLGRALIEINRAMEMERKKGFANRLSLVKRGDVYRFTGDYQKALADYNAALRTEPDFIPALTALGLTYEKLGDFTQARARFVEATHSQSKLRFYGSSKKDLATAEARLAALDSGVPQPTIPAVPLNSKAPSIPTPAIHVPNAISNVRADRRVALVIGNSAYMSVAPLANPKNDAQAIATSLRNVGFQSVTLINDATREKLIDALRAFANEAENSDWAMVYYAGHGIEIGGTNYLIPTDAKLAVDRDIEYEAVAVAQVLRAAASARKIKLVMLDACRVNPFKPRKTEVPEAIAASEFAPGRGIAARSTIGRGFARIEVAAGATLVVFAARDGQIALDGEGANSPFAIAVTQRIATPGVELNKIFRLVRDDVMEATAGRQEPYTYGSLPGKEDFYFVAK